MKDFYIQYNIGHAKYVVNSHDGIQTHKDGSPFYGCAIFKNKPSLNAYISKLKKEGYNERGHAG